MLAVNDDTQTSSFSIKLYSLYQQYKYFLSQGNCNKDQRLVCETLIHEFNLIFKKGVFNGQNLVSLLEILIASDVLRGEDYNEDDISTRYLQLCNDQLKDLLYVSFKEVIK